MSVEFEEEKIAEASVRSEGMPKKRIAHIFGMLMCIMLLSASVLAILWYRTQLAPQPYIVPTLIESDNNLMIP